MTPGEVPFYFRAVQLLKRKYTGIIDIKVGLEIDFNDYADQNGNTVLIGSIPYSITTPILLKFLENCSIFKRAVFIIQKEVAERLCAEPGSKDYGIFSIYCSTYLKPSIVQIIPSQCFFPKPKTDYTRARR